MATITISHASVNMHNAYTTYGSVVAADANHLEIVSGSYDYIYYGSFSYDYYGNVYGTLTGTTEKYLVCRCSASLG
jgi:hypothetical protein